MALDDVLADCQTEPRAARLLRRVERLEDVRQGARPGCRLRRRGSPVSMAPSASQAGRDPQIAFLRHGIDRIDHHRQHDLLDLRRIAMCRRQLGSQIQVELNAGRCPACAAPAVYNGRSPGSGRTTPDSWARPARSSAGSAPARRSACSRWRSGRANLSSLPVWATAAVFFSIQRFTSRSRSGFRTAGC